jgi:hypothetical protein
MHFHPVALPAFSQIPQKLPSISIIPENLFPSHLSHKSTADPTADPGIGLALE